MMSSALNRDVAHNEEGMKRLALSNTCSIVERIVIGGGSVRKLLGLGSSTGDLRDPAVQQSIFMLF